MSTSSHQPVRTVEVKAADLTPSGDIFCPNPLANMALWNGHPRVYVNVSKAGGGKCPYCGTEYRLAAGEQVAHSH